MDFVLAWTDLCLIFQLWNASLKANIFFFFILHVFIQLAYFLSQQSFQKSF